MRKLLNVSLPKENDLKYRMQRFNIKEADLVERFVRSSGHGGQNINKVATCVYLKHNPTGIEVKYGRERSQALNRFMARRILVGKIESMMLGKASQERARIEKIRRQKRKRSKRAKEKILRDKKKRGERKTLRRCVDADKEH